jgi:hypothetical protein
MQHYMGAEPSLAQQAAGAVSSIASQAVSTSGLVRSVQFRSSISPDIDLDPRTAAGPSAGMPRRRGGFSEGLMAFVKPEVVVMTAGGPIRLAPWGRPTTNYFWPVVILGVAGTLALSALALRGIRAGRS